VGPPGKTRNSNLKTGGDWEKLKVEHLKAKRVKVLVGCSVRLFPMWGGFLRSPGHGLRAEEGFWFRVVREVVPGCEAA